MIDEALQPSPETPNQQPFTLLGGPLHRFGRRLGLVRAGNNTVALGFAIAVPLWVVLLILALVDGYDVFSFDVIGAHARMLLVVPLLFAGESTFDPRLPDFIRAVNRLAMPAEVQAELHEELARITRLKDAWLPEVLCLLSALALFWLVPLMQLPGTVGYHRDIGANLTTMAARWYWAACLPVFRFLMLRWIWRLCLWSRLLWRVSRLPLRLLASHPDGVGGLGTLEVAQGHFVPLLLANSAMLAASFASDIHAGRMTLEAAVPALSVLLSIDALVFVGPLFFFFPTLWDCRVKGISDYGELAERYVGDFEAKWLRAAAPPDEQLLGTGDIQSLADIGGSLNRVTDMRAAPVSARLWTQFAVAALLPVLPLTLFKYPFSGLAKQLFTLLTGL
jgi:hypothetical protein